MKQLLNLYIVDPPQHLTSSTQDLFYQHIYELVQSQVAVILVNLEKVSCLDSGGLGILFGAFHLSNRQGKRFMLYSPQSHVNNNLHQTGLTQIVRTYATLTDCIKDVIPYSQRLGRRRPLNLPDLEQYSELDLRRD